MRRRPKRGQQRCPHPVVCPIREGFRDPLRRPAGVRYGRLHRWLVVSLPAYRMTWVPFPGRHTRLIGASSDHGQPQPKASSSRPRATSRIQPLRIPEWTRRGDDIVSRQRRVTITIRACFRDCAEVAQLTQKPRGQGSPTPSGRSSESRWGWRWEPVSCGETT